MTKIERIREHDERRSRKCGTPPATHHWNVVLDDGPEEKIVCSVKNLFEKYIPTECKNIQIFTLAKIEYRPTISSSRHDIYLPGERVFVRLVGLNRENIRITVDRSSGWAEEFAAYLKKQGYDADVEPAGRHTSGKHTVTTDEVLSDFYESEEEFVNQLWSDFSNGR